MAATRRGDMALTDAHARSAADCLAALKTRSEGLAPEEAARRLRDGGPNRLPEAPARGPVRRFLAQLHNVLIYVLLGAALITAAMQHWVDTA